MKLRITNYRRFIFMAILTSLVIFLIAWGIVFCFQHLFMQETEEKRGEIVAPEDENSPFLILINANYPLEPEYVPTDLVELNLPADTALSLAKDAAQATQALFLDAEEAGIDLKAMSAYRSYEDQESLHNAESDQGSYVEGVESVSPGTSEHQTGLALDISTGEIDYALNSAFAETAAGQWVEENAQNYGFIIRYPEGKEVMTGTIYEPWHLRYVGVEDAKKITENNLTLEEYLQKLSGASDESSADSVTTES